MVHSCIVNGCNNKSNDPQCTGMSWHCITSRFDTIKSKSSIPARLVGKHLSELRNYRICDECMSKVHCKQQRKLPVKRLATPSNTSRFTRQELRDAIRHDHCYSLPPLSIDSSMLTPTKSDSVPITLPKDIPLVHFSIEIYKNDNAAITCYTSFPTYDHLMACFNFLGEAVQHLKYPSHSSNAMIRLRQNQSLSPLNEFFLTLCRLKRGLTIQDLAYRFQVSPSTVSRIFTS